MKKTAIIMALSLIFLPAVTHASWWNPFTWTGKQDKAELLKQDNVASVTASTTESADVPVAPKLSIDDLLKRIAELEDKLQKALSKNGDTAVKAETKLAPAVPSQTSNYSDKDITAKVKPAIVLIETATSSDSGSVIDSSGHILTNAHTVWTKDESGVVTGFTDKIWVTFSNGTKKPAILVGIDEAHDLAILQVPNSGTLPYIKLNYDSGVVKDNKVYVFGFPSTKGTSNGGSSFVSGVVVKKDSSTIESVTDSKPLDNGGVLVNSNGSVIGMVNKPTCRVLEQGEKCLKYTVTVSNVNSVLPKVIEGMKLYKKKVNSDYEELLIRGQLEGMYNNLKQVGVIDFTITSVTGQNSFDYFNNKLGDDQEGKIVKLYLIKLKQIADNINKSTEFLKSLSYELSRFFINESAPIGNLGTYQNKIIKKIEADNLKKLDEYTAKVNLWSKKKNEYDAWILKPAEVSKDYLMEQGVFVESAIDYLIAEKKRILDTFSGEAVNIF